MCLYGTEDDEKNKNKNEGYDFSLCEKPPLSRAASNMFSYQIIL